MLVLQYQRAKRRQVSGRVLMILNLLTWKREMVVGLETFIVELFFLVTAKVQWMVVRTACE